MKRALAILCAAALAASLAGCQNSGSGSSSGTAHSDASLTGQITAIEGTAVTLQLGTLETAAPGEGGPGGDGSEAGPSGGEKPDDGGQPPEGGGESGGADASQPPALPDGQAPGGDGAPPELPDGADSAGGGGPGSAQPENGGGPGGMGGGAFTAGEETVTLDFSGAVLTREGGAEDDPITLDDLAVGDVLTVETDGGGAAASAVVRMAGGGAAGGFGGSGTVTQGSAANTLSEDGTYTGESYTSAGDDENALRVDGAAVTLDGVTVEKTGGASSNAEDGDFYGMNAALLATGGAQVTIQNAAVTSAAQNGNGVFSYGSGTVVNISDSTITTSADNSGGIQTTGGGVTNASNLTVTTAGDSSAAIRSDRGGGVVTVDGGSYTSSGYNSPAVYSTAQITVKNAVLTANRSEALVIEGQNSIALENCQVSGNMSDTQGASSDENVHGVMIYQSMSGDAQVGTSSFSMTGGRLTSQNGDLFYVTNTHCLLALSGAELVNSGGGCLLRVAGNSAGHGWGTAGANGGQVELTADGQTLEGDIVVDSISTLEMTLTGGSDFTGTVNIVENAQGGAAAAENVLVTVEAGCSWTLTGNCTLTGLDNKGTVNYNGYTITLADGTVLGG